MKLLALFLFPVLSFAQSDSINVLFLGNSYTSANNLPNIVSDIANSMGDYFEFQSNTVGGATLQIHTNNSNSTDLIMLDDWNYVVLQEQSQYPSFPLWQVEEDVFPYAAELNQLIIDYNECARTVFFMTWGRENGDQSNCDVWPPVCTYEGMDDLLQERYIMMANDNDAMLSPVGSVWRYMRDSDYEIDLYSSDGSHPSEIGSYTAGVCFYTTLFRKDPTEIEWNGNESWGITSDDADLIKETVKTVVYDNFDFWNIEDDDINNNGICDQNEEILQNELCDSISISFVEYNSYNNEFEIEVSVNYTDSYWFPYSGFMLTDNQGDTIAVETFGTAVNVYGIGTGMIENRILVAEDLESPFIPFNGTLHLVDYFFAGTPSIACSFPFSIDCDSFSADVLVTDMSVDGDYGCEILINLTGGTSPYYCTLGVEFLGLGDLSSEFTISNLSGGLYNLEIGDSNNCALSIDVGCGGTPSINDLGDLDNKNLIKLIDALGRETTNKGFHIEIYDDGSVEKKYFFK